MPERTCLVQGCGRAYVARGWCGKHDNRPENLELWSSSQPAGQRVEDKIAWARMILERYDT